MLPLQFSRRDMLRTLPGFGMVALAGICAEESARAAGYSNPLAPKSPHFPPRAKRVVMITMRGGPSHVDTFDYKPALAKHAGEAVANDNKSRKLLPSPFKFSPHGESGLMISEVYPHVAKHADDLCLLNSMQTDVPNHPQAFLMAHTGEFRFPRPSLGAWTLYGLGTENKDLPGFVTISPPSRFGGSQNYGAGFLPAIYQGTNLGQSGQPVAGAEISNLRPQPGGSGEQRRQLDLVQELNREFLNRKTENLELEGAIESYELAFRMQGALPDVMRLDRETAQTLEMYGIGNGVAGRNGKQGGGGPADFGRQCLMARRLLEAGVRFVEVCHEGWDQHNGLKEKITSNALATDQPIGALLTDLKQRGMLKDTLVVWGGEFGRTPGGQSDNGRDHNSRGFSMWAAGGGIKGGQRYGATDEFGYEAIENKMHHHDLHATMLHLLGLDHDKLTYRFGGRDYKLTGVSNAQVAKGIIA
jgi:hypothetical protein